MNALGATILILLCAVILVTPKRWALLGMMSSILYLTQFQAVPLGGFNMFAYRFLELAIFVRVLARGEIRSIQFNRIDTALIVLYVYTVVVFLIRGEDDQSRAYVIGLMVDALLCYFSFRALVTDLDELRWFMRAFVFLLVPYMALLWREHMTGRNPFYILGAVADDATRDDGSPRACGSFRYAGLLGTLGATLLPIYFGMLFRREDRKISAVGIFFCIIIIYVSNSGGPINAVAVAMVGWMLWFMRKRMRTIRWGIVAFIAVSAMVMKAPVWYLIAKASDITGGDGWHRSYLIDVSFRHLDQWWLAGMKDELTKDWFPYVVAATGAADITNAYISFGLTAGVMSIVFFVRVLSRAYSQLGLAMHAVRTASEETSQVEYLLWGVGCMLAAHIATWFGVTYWDQTYILWFFHLAVLSTLSQRLLNESAAAETSEEISEEFAEEECAANEPS